MPDTHGAGAFAPIRAAEITDEIWLEVARHHAGGAPMRAQAERARVASSPAAIRPVPPNLPLSALLELDGPAFVEAAYATVLGRAADDTGAAYIASELGRGRSKIELLGGLQASDEGRRSGREIAGLRTRYLARRLYRVPVLGRFARIAATALQGAGLLRAARARPAGMPAAFEARLGTLELALDSRRRALEDRVVELQSAVELSTRRLAVVQSANEEYGRKSHLAVAEQARRLTGLTERSAGFARQLEATEDSVIDSLLALSDRVVGQEARLAAIEGGVDLGTVAGRIDRAAGDLRADLDTRVIAAEATAAQNRRDVVDQQRRIGLMLNALRERVPKAVQAEDDHALDELYLQFEDRFRGTRDDVKRRQRAYLPRLRDAGIGTVTRPVLDIGAGRGEFLELMRDEGLVASGVDANAAMVAACRETGLACTEGDALTYLAAQPDGSLGAITGFHIVEHLPFKVMVRIMDEALRVLMPNGLIVFETPNPANILTASRYFYLDPTHRNPLPGEMMAMIAEARGFVDAEVVEMHPMTARFPGADRLLAGALDKIFHGPQDYALVARRPLSSPSPLGRGLS